MATLKVTITATIPLAYDNAVEQAKATLAVNETLEAITQKLQVVGATDVSEKMAFGRAKRKKGEPKQED